MTPSGPGKTASEGLAARISSGLIGLAIQSWTGCCVHSGMVTVAGCVNTVVHRSSRWLLGILNVSQDVLDTLHAVGAPVTLRRSVFSASGLTVRLLLLVGCGPWWDEPGGKKSRR